MRAPSAQQLGEAVREKVHGLDRSLQAARSGPCVDARRIEAVLSLLPPGFSHALLAGSFSRAGLARGAAGEENGVARNAPLNVGLAGEDEDAEFERRAGGHLGVWAAPTDADVADADEAEDAETLEGLQTRARGGGTPTIVLDGGQPCIDVARGSLVSASERGPGGTGRHEYAQLPGPAERGGAAETAAGGSGPGVSDATWRERLMQTIGVATCCTAGDVEGEESSGSPVSASGRTRGTADDTPSAEQQTPGRQAVGPAGGLQDGPGDRGQGLGDKGRGPEEPVRHLSEAAERTREWATLFEQGWVMAAGGVRAAATAGDNGPRINCSQAGGSEHVGSNVVETEGGKASAATTRLSAFRSASFRDTQAAPIDGKPEVGHESRTEEAARLWVAPLYCTESEEAEERTFNEQQEGWENGILRVQDSTPASRRDNVTVHMTPEAGSEAPAHICAPAARPRASPVAGTRAAGAAVKNMIHKLKSSPGGLFRKTSLQVSAHQSVPQGAAARGASSSVEEHSPAARITDLVKKAEEEFEKEYGAGSWGVPTRRLSRRAGTGDDHVSSDEEDDDLVV